MAEKTAEQKVKYLILAVDASWKDADLIAFDQITGEVIDAAYQQLVDADEHWDAQSEVRGGEVETGLKCEWSRNYESKAVAAKLPDGSWVGWTYWYGGGKHSEPEAIDWIDEAYDLNCVEEEKVVTVRTFSEAAARSSNLSGE
ncbi:hypothetical protein EVB98_038 [Rhizobium phage RHph_N3_2]|nr:hypothetical protein EVB98_038 [Rhizobium phage RHph_N3_2]